MKKRCRDGDQYCLFAPPRPLKASTRERAVKEYRQQLKAAKKEAKRLVQLGWTAEYTLVCAALAHSDLAREAVELCEVDDFMDPLFASALAACASLIEAGSDTAVHLVVRQMRKRGVLFLEGGVMRLLDCATQGYEKEANVRKVGIPKMVRMMREAKTARMQVA